MEKLRSWAWHRLVYLADRISPEDAFRCTGYSMRLTRGKGWVFEEHDGKNGVKLWYKGYREYNEHSHDRYDEEPAFNIHPSSGMTPEDIHRTLCRAHWGI